MAVAEYKSEITAKWIYNDEETNIEPTSISYILFDYDFDSNNMPLAYMTLNLQTSLYNKMVEHSDDSTLFLDIKRYNANAKNQVRGTDICEQFKYFLPTDKDKNQELTNSASEHNQDETSYVHVTLGLMKSEVYDDNKRAFDDMVFTGNLSTLIYLGLDHVKRLCINAVSDNVDIVGADIPPMSSVSEYLRYIDDNWGTYDYGYRYFHDYRTTYMLDEDPHYVPNGNSQFKDVNINILDDTDEKASTGGIIVNKQREVYEINVGAKHCSFNEDKGTDTAINTKVCIDDDGNITSSKISGKADTDTKKVTYNRSTGSENSTNFSIKKYKTTLSVSRTQLDGHLFTPNKIYHVNGYKGEEKYNGQYVLWQKRTVYQMKGEDIIPTTSLILRKLVI